MDMMNYFYWDPDPVVLTLPWIDHPIRWYGILFSIGFALCYMTFYSFLKKVIASDRSHLARMLADRLIWYTIIGTLIGSRLGFVLIYDPAMLWTAPLDLFKTWQGGLASHGGMLGVFIALFFYYRFLRKSVDLPFRRLIDLVAMVLPLACAFIRIGNFINQEIIGLPTDLPWAVIYGHPYEGIPGVPYHPVQLYEAGAYLILFAALCLFARFRLLSLRPGLLGGVAIVSLCLARFYLETFKTPQGGFLSFLPLETSQTLLIPFILLGLYFILPTKKKYLDQQNTIG